MRKTSLVALIGGVTILAGLGGAGVAATGGNFILGQSNSAGNTTALSSGVTSGATLSLTNSGGKAAASFTVNSGAPPFAVSGSQKVVKLNADLLDGKDSTALPYWKLGGNGGTTPGTDFLGTSDSKALELRVHGQRALRIEPAATPNLIGGAAVNSAAAGVVGATISGGGQPSVSENTVMDDLGTIGGGADNRAGDFSGSTTDARGATVGGGVSNRASGPDATVGGGSLNAADESQATVAGGQNNHASNVGSTVGGGLLNTANSVGATVPGGRFNEASGFDSFAAGEFAKAVTNGTFVWADETFADFSSTADNQFLVRARGGVGIGTNAPATQLHVAKSENATATPGNHVALVQNTSTGDSGDGLAVKIGYTGNPTAANNFVTFFKGNDLSVGAIQGNGSGGVVLAGPGNDYAEWLPKLDPRERLRPGDVVGIFDGKISKATRGAAQIMVVSGAPIVAGNDPGSARRAGYAPVAFVGQVAVRVNGRVQAGNFLVPSGGEDGSAVAVSPDAVTSRLVGRIIGRAWSGSAKTSVGTVRVAVGIGATPAATTLARENLVLRARIERQNVRLTRLEQAVARLSR